MYGMGQLLSPMNILILNLLNISKWMKLYNSYRIQEKHFLNPFLLLYYHISLYDKSSLSKTSETLGKSMLEI